VSPEGGSDYADEAAEGPSPEHTSQRALSSQHLQHMELEAALDLAEERQVSSTAQAQAVAMAAAARVRGLRDDAPPN
jgi:hypothetical protein